MKEQDRDEFKKELLYQRISTVTKIRIIQLFQDLEELEAFRTRTIAAANGTAQEWTDFQLKVG